MFIWLAPDRNPFLNGKPHFRLPFRSNIPRKYKELLDEMDEMRDRFKRQSERHKQHTLKMIIGDFLPVVDSIERALETDIEKDNPWMDGLQKTHDQFLSILKKYDVQQTPGRGAPFDPHWHEAISVQQTEDYEENTVIEVIQEGYSINGHLLRPGKVIVAQKP
ncbi:nucleotide exchange factor GrpE [bacterium]|nr:nucleotide exchange factor GrpE [bacterium]